ncbi:MAG: decaprenylphospho-beta-D-erythro-pentofuranosid-2-ulose 2-reductase, partial [Actinomycetes bacterium]
MIDGVGNVHSILVLGGIGDVSVAIVDRLVGPRLTRVVLGAPASPELDNAVTRIRGFGVGEVRTVDFDPREDWSHARLIDSVFDAGDIDVVVLIPGPQVSELTDPSGSIDATAAIEVLSATLTGSASAALQLTRRMGTQG